MFDHTTQFSVIVSLLDVCSFVAVILAARECDFNFEVTTIGKVGLGGNESKAWFLLLLFEFANVAFVKQKPSDAERLMVKVIAGKGTRTDMCIVKI